MSLIGRLRRRVRDRWSVALSFPRRQQIRRLRRAVRHALAGLGALAIAVVLGARGAVGAAVLSVGVAAAMLLASHHALRLARRSRVGADSEARVRYALNGLRTEGWRVRHGIAWPGGGDIDHVVRSPDGLGFAIEIKTVRYNRGQLARTAATARWLARRRRRYPRGVVPVLCVIGARDGPTVEYGVWVVSLGELPAALRALAQPSDGRRAHHVRRRAFAGRAAARL